MQRYGAIIAAIVVCAGVRGEARAGGILGTAENFAVLGASTVTNTGATTVVGNLGLYPGTSVTGFPPGTVTGTQYINDAVAMTAQADASTAYTYLKGLAPTANLTGEDLGSLGGPLTQGVYSFATSATLNGTLTLSGPGIFVFQIGSTLITGATAPASIVLTNGASADDVYFQVGSSATLDTGTMFAGTIIAEASDSLLSGASVNGRVIALTAAVTLIDNAITISSVPEPSSIVLVVCGLPLLVALGKRARTSAR
jgi:type VI secretion system secreted protein VgrG